MNTQNAPTWAKEAVAQGWTYGSEEYRQTDDALLRKLANGCFTTIEHDGSGSVHDGEPWTSTYLVVWGVAPVSETLKLANEFAAANGGWA